MIKKLILTFFVVLSAHAFAQVRQTATFNFANPQSLNPSINPEDYSGQTIIPVRDVKFKSGNIQISFTLFNDTMTAQGARIRGIKYTGEDFYRYALQITHGTNMIVEGQSGATLDSIICDQSQYSSKGDLDLTDGYGGVLDYTLNYALHWKNNTSTPISKVSFSNYNSITQLPELKVYYTTPSDILVPTASISNGVTVESFNGMALTFDRNMYVGSSANITLSNGTTTQNMSASFEGKVVTLTPEKPITTDGTYTITVPAKRFRASDGYENAALTYTFKVSTPKNTFSPTSIDPEQGTVASLNSPITLTFDGIVGNVSTSKLVLQKDGERYVAVQAAKKQGNSKAVELSFDIPEGISETGTYTLNIPEGTIENSFGDLYNPAMTLQYVIGGTTPDPDPDPQPGTDSETMKLAKQLLLRSGVGYPATGSTSRTALEALTTAETTPTDAELQAAIDAFYAETNVTLPTAGKYYKIAGVSASGSRAYLSYKDGSVGLTTSNSAAATFEAEEQGTVTAFKTTDGKYLHVLTTSSDYDLTSPSNVTDTYNATVNNLSLAKFAKEGTEATATFGLLSIHGVLGNNTITGEAGEVYALVKYGTTLSIGSSVGYPLVFSENNSSAFEIYEVSKPSTTDTLSVSPDCTLSVSDDNSLLTLTFSTIQSDMSVNNATTAYITDSKGNLLENVEVNKVSGTTNQFTAKATKLYAGGTFTLVMPEGKFVFTSDGKIYKTTTLTKGFSIGSKQEEIAFDKSYTSVYITPNTTGTKPGTALNNIVISMADGYGYTGLVADESKTVIILAYYQNVEVRYGHFKAYTIPEDPTRPAIKLELNKEIGENELVKDTYVVVVPEATFGDANFGKYLQDKNSVSPSLCKVNGTRKFSYAIDNSVNGIEGLNTDTNAPQTIYDLTGRKVERITRPGIYIVNGKKVVKK